MLTHCKACGYIVAQVDSDYCDACYMAEVHKKPFCLFFTAYRGSNSYDRRVYFATEEEKNAAKEAIDTKRPAIGVPYTDFSGMTAIPVSVRRNTLTIRQGVYTYKMPISEFMRRFEL